MLFVGSFKYYTKQKENDLIMGFKRTEHKNALLKLIKHKGMMLQVDAAKRLNKNSVSTTAEALEKEGKIKRQKVRVRMINGNLNDSWLLYIPGTNPNDILDYERELINRPFESPLKENHCYKKVELDPDRPNTIEIMNNTDNVINMSDYVKISECDIEIKTYNNKRVVTAYDIAQIHQKEPRLVNEQLKRNQKYFLEGEDYFIIHRENSKIADCDFEKYFTSPRQKELYLFTESGYMMLTKSFNDDLSWSVQRQLVNTYFKVKQLKEEQTLQNIPQVQNIQTLDIMEMMIKQMRNYDQRISNLENKLITLGKAISE